MPAPLPWRKLPRDLMVKPEIQYIIKRLEPQKKHAVFTVMTALYCYADDSGIVDISDRDLFTDICLFSTHEELLDMLGRLEARKLVSRIHEDAFQIEGWEPPFGQAPRPAGETWSDRLQRTAAAAGASGPRPAPDEPSPAELAAMAMAESASQEQEGKSEAQARPRAPEVSLFDPAEAGAAPAEAEASGKKRKRSHKKKQNDTETKNVSVSLQPEEKRQEESRGEETRGEENRPEEKRTHTQITAPPGPAPAASVGLRPPSGGAGPSPGAAETAQMRLEKDERETRTQGEEGPDQSIPTEEGQAGTAGKVSRSSTDQEVGTHQSDGTDRQEAEVLRRGSTQEGIPALELEKPFHAFWVYFKRQNPGGYADQKLEEEAMMKLSFRAHALGTEKTPPEIIACTMAGAFSNLINKGGYFEGMPCIPSMLLKPGNYAKTLAKLQKTLYPRGNEPGSFKKEWEILAEEAEKIKKETANEVPEEVTALIYGKYGIDPNDPARFAKLKAAKAGEKA